MEVAHEQVLVQEPEFSPELLAAPGAGREAPEEVQVAAAVEAQANLMMKTTIQPEAIPQAREEAESVVLEPMVEDPP